MKSRLSLLAALLSLLLCTSHFSVSFAQETKAAKAPENPKEQPVAGLEAAAAAAVGAGGQVQADGSEVPLEGAKLDAAVKDAAEAQEVQEEADQPVIAQVVKIDPAVELASGDGDVSTTGACLTDVEQFCAEIAPGEGRLAACLAQQLVEQAKDGYGGQKVSGGCKSEVDEFKIDRSTNINLDLPVAKACKTDAETLCKELSETEESVLSCLRTNKDALTEGCRDMVFERQVEAADDFRTDKELFEACEVDANNICPKVDPSGGAIQECLKHKRTSLSFDCQEQLFRQEVENADDIRLSTKLFRTCLEDKKKFCPDVKPGNARAKECLEDHREDTGFSGACKDLIVRMMEDRAADFRLDAKLRELCAVDIDDICVNERDSLDSIAGYDARVIQCLQDYRDEIQDPACQARVHKVMKLASADIRFNIPLADACYDDRQKFCQNVPPGSARVIRCLQDRREELSYDCKAVLFDEEVLMAEDIDFQFPMKKACANDIPRFCAKVPPGHARVIRCLQENLEQPNMSEECKTEVQKHEARSGEDYRLNYRLSVACETTIAEKCADSCSGIGFNVEHPCGGKVLRCLTDKMDEITVEECKAEVFYFEKMEVRDFRNDVILAEACRKDVESLCNEVERGEGRVLSCLRDNRAKLSEKCRAEETKLSILASSNAELLPGLNKACAEERSSHCNGVRPGKARVFNCLLANSDKVDFSAQCKTQMLKQQERRLKDWRLDYNLRVACKDDVTTVCKAALERQDTDRDASGVLQCLVDIVASGGASVSQGCAVQVSRSARNSLQFYQPKLPVANVCDADAEKLCVKGQQMTNIGFVRKCLTDQLGEINLPADEQVTFTAPEVVNDAAAPVEPVPEETAKPAEEPAKPAEEPAKTEATSRKLLVDPPVQPVLAEPVKGGALTAPCKALVQLSAPGDVYAAYDNTLSATAVATHLKSIESKLGLKSGTLYGAKANKQGVTLTGWSALIGMSALVVVVLGGGYIGYRKYFGLESGKNYALVLKSDHH